MVIVFDIIYLGDIFRCIFDFIFVILSTAPTNIIQKIFSKIHIFRKISHKISSKIISKNTISKNYLHKKPHFLKYPPKNTTQK